MTRQSKTYICWLSTRRQENPRRIQKYKYKYKKRVDCIPCWKTVRLLMIQCLTNSILESFSEFLMIFILFCWFLLSTWCLYFCIDRLRLVWLNGCDQQQNRYTLKNKRHKSQCLAYSFCVKKLLNGRRYVSSSASSPLLVKEKGALLLSTPCHEERRRSELKHYIKRTCGAVAY